MEKQIPENWFQKIAEDDLLDAIVKETEEMILSLSVHFNINQPNQDNILAALAHELKKPAKEVLQILNAFIQFKVKIWFFESLYGGEFHQDEAENLLLSPDIIEMVYGNSDSGELALIQKTQQELATAGIFIAWMDIKFAYFS